MCKLIKLNNRSLLSLSGPDSEIFLQNLITNDMNNFSDNTSIYSALLTPQGKFLFDFFLVKSKDEIYIDCNSSQSVSLLEKLLSYKLRSKIDISIKSKLSVYALIFKDKQNSIPMENRLGFTRIEQQNLFYIDPRSINLGIRIIGYKHNIEKTFNNSNIKKGTIEDWEKIRITSVIPEPIKDMEPNKSFLLEYNFENLYGVSFTKGCFIGQENTARQKNRGTLKKELVAVSINGNPPKIGTEITLEGKYVGIMKSSLMQIGLAILSKKAISEAIQEEKDFLAGESIIRLKK